ncbi:MAG: glycosyltransferase family 2 protein [Anaerolineae bacterium]|jgi:cellulose synthase/poly-beta-1,6-N-acetylglucosamine synthase-like glycosyltransferase|nr:glycosyltransferase family 2 protein [Anaerolineae bacterium]
MGNLDLLSYEALLEESFPLEISDKPQNQVQHRGLGQIKHSRSLILDGITGWVAWSAILIVVVGAIFSPVFVFTLSAIVGIYMAGRFVMAGFLALGGVIRIKRAQNIDWRTKYAHLRRADSLAWSDVLHVLVIPNYKEDYQVLHDTLSRIAESPLAKTNVCVVLGMEEREQGASAKAESLMIAFESRFLHIITTFHPKDIPGEVAGKSSNEAWATREAYNTLVIGHGYDMDNMVITIMDADSLIHPRYLEAVTCHFATTPAQNRYNEMWQAPIRYDNNISKVHPFFTFIHAYSTAWYLSGLSGRHPMPLSTYSLSFRLAHEVGYWDTDVIPEDWHMYIKCYFKKGGNLRLTPIYLPFSGYSAAVGETFMEAVRSQYAQSVRHMWGAEDVGYILDQSSKHQSMPILPQLTIFWRVFHNHALSTTGWIITNLGVQLALLIYPNLQNNPAISTQMALLHAIIQIIIAVSILFWVIDMRMRPQKSWTIGEWILTAISFIIMPFTTVVMTIMPALEAQTRLMLGIPIHYRVARKV